MTRAGIFWVIMLLWLLFGLGEIFWVGAPIYVRRGGDLMLFVLIGLLGWKTFGAAIKGD